MVDVADVDICVIGAGIAGAAAAWALAEHASVVLVEQEPHPGHHASGRSASVLSTSSGHPLVCRLAAASRAFFVAPPDGFADVPLVAPKGLMWVGRPGDERLLDEIMDSASPVSTGLARLTPTEALQRLPGFREEAVAAGAVIEPDALAIDVAALLSGFVAGLRRRGGRLLTSSEAVELHRRSQGWRVRAGSTDINAGAVVDAAGAWGDVVAGRAGVAPIGLRPLRRTAAIVPAPDFVRSWPLVMDAAGRFYLEPDSGGLLVSPADETESIPCDARPDELDVALALDHLAAATTVPVRTVRRTWAGLRTFAPDRVPVVGEDPDVPGFWWLVGQGGAGIKTAPALAWVLSALMAGRALPAALTDLGITEAALSPSRVRRAQLS